jgi:hypothetical protein
MAAWGFSADPFAQYVAEKEERLDRSFVAPNYFEDIVGDPDRPQPAFVFGSRGEGKSTLCRMVAQRLEGHERPPLVVHVNDFSEWSIGRIDHGLTLEDHVLRILGASAVALVETLEASPRPLLGLSKRDRALLGRFVARLLPLIDEGEHERRLAMLIDHANEAGSLRRQAGQAMRWLWRFLRRKRFEFERGKLKDEYNSLFLALLMLVAPGTQGSATIQAVFGAFAMLVRRLGFPSMYVLVDKVDEVEAVINRSDRVAKLVASLVGSVKFLESDGLGIKIFLPEEARRDIPGLRTDRIHTHQIQWDEQRLRAFLRKRIQAYSDGRHDGLEHVIEDYVGFEPQLLRASARAPRNLLRILHLIVGKHCEREDHSVMVTRADADAALQTFKEYRKQEGDLELYEARLNAWDLEHGSKEGAS